jgi:hypothetical protein
MARKAAWILVLLVALLVISMSAAFAASLTRPALASRVPQGKMSTVGVTSTVTLAGISDGRHTATRYNHDQPWGCHHSESTSSPAY